MRWLATHKAFNRVSWAIFYVGLAASIWALFAEKRYEVLIAGVIVAVLFHAFTNRRNRGP